ncbi:MAG: MOSC domain-containing protein [Alphaproteobacteria bacterium]|nr:MOSC domain-containing protein [Alphaproteobacteria bacterium]
MKLLAVSVGTPKEVSYVDRKGRELTTTTGIFKTPVDGRVVLRRTNLDGDGQADLEAHGGPDKAVYAYSRENYDFWAAELGRDDFADAGQFGENFTVVGMSDEDVCVGDRFRVGGALAEVTQPRVPCFKLGILMGIEGFQKQFAAACRTGFYLRVLEEGEAGAGDVIERAGYGDVRMSVRDMMHLLYFEPDNIAGAKKALEIEALSPGWRGSFEERVAKASN